ncbi:MAG: T9SS type B sorting domain-containing protein [Bacteroidia bacterium]
MLLKKMYRLLLLLLLCLPFLGTAQINCDEITPRITQFNPASFQNNIYTVDYYRNVTISADIASTTINPADVTFRWDFGNNAFVYGQNLNYSFGQAGTITLILTALYNGCEMATTYTINVQNGNPFSLYRQFNGRYDYLAIGNTLNMQENAGILVSDECGILTQSSANLSILPTQRIEAAYLYWAGSGLGDFDVKLNNIPVSAQRTFFSTIDLGSNRHKPSFGAFADVTSIVQNSGTYTVSDFNISQTLASDLDYCYNGINFGGWSVVIVYSDSILPYNQVGVYDGFKTVDQHNPLLQIYLDNLNVVNTAGAKIGFLAWEGDAAGSTNESLKINGTAIGNSLNPVTNPFNSTNSFTGATNLWNMDIDFYNIQNRINVGDTDLDVTLTTSQDAVIVHNIVTVVNSELPDASIEMFFHAGDEICGNRELLLVYEAKNYNSTAPLPVGTPIAIYADNVLVGTTATTTQLPIGSSEINTYTLTLPASVPDTFNLTMAIDDDGTGVGSVRETDESNNTYTEQIILTTTLPAQTIDSLTECAVNNGTQAQFDLTQATTQIIGYDLDYYPTAADAAASQNIITDPQHYLSATGMAYVRIYNAATPVCYSIEPIPLTVNDGPALSRYTTPFVYVACPDATSSNTATITSLNSIAPNLKDEAFQPLALLATPGEVLSDYTITYHANQNDALLGNAALADGYTATHGDIIYVRVQANSGNNCVSVGQVQFHIERPVVINPTPLAVCGASGSGTFNLSVKNNEIAPQPNTYLIRYYDSQTFAMAGGTNNLSATSYIGTNNQQVYARVEDAVTGCYSIATLQLVVNPIPTANQPNPLSVCEGTTPGFGTFNLRSIEAGLGLTPLSNYVITYHADQPSADVGTPQITGVTAYNNTVANAQTIYVRVTPVGTPGCYQTLPLQLVVNQKPAAPHVTDYSLCDDPLVPGSNAAFNLTTKNNEATAGNATLTVTYYTTLAAAESGTGFITTTANYPVNGTSQTIYVRVQNAQGCYNTGSFNLIVSPAPALSIGTPEFRACERTAGRGEFSLSHFTDVILGATSPYTIKYYESITDAAANNANNITANPYMGQTGSIYGLVTDPSTGCSTIITIDLVVEVNWVIAIPQPLEACDADNDGIATFNLQPVIDQIRAGISSPVTITVHETPEDASFGTGVNPIANVTSYSNILRLTGSRVQTLYIKVSSAATECFSIVPLQLVVNPSPVIPTPLQDYEVCDNGTSDNDGQGVFDLTTYRPVVLNGLSATQYSVTYYETENDAIANTATITTPATYLSANTIIYIRLTNNATGCYDTAPLELIVNPLPIVTQPTPMNLCDVNNPGDERELFDLTSKINEITGGVNGLRVTFHTTYNGAENNTDFVTNPTAFLGTPGVQSVFVRVANDVSGCYRIVILDVRVVPLPRLTLPTTQELTVCDTDGSGFGIFNLQDLSQDMMNNGANLKVDFYLTHLNAELGINKITNTSAFQNISPNIQFIYAVATDAITGCRSIVYPLTLTVAEAPKAITLQDITLCDDFDANGQDGVIIFDLTQQDTTLLSQLGITSLAGYNVYYFASEAAASAGFPRLTMPQAFRGVEGQEVYVRVEVIATGCYTIAGFTLHVNAPQELHHPDNYIICDNVLPNDNRGVFDLTTRNDEILTSTGIGESNIVTYFVTEADRDANRNAITTPEAFANTMNPQVIFVRVTTPDGCVSKESLTLMVNNPPAPNLNPLPLEVCDYTTLYDGFEPFNLNDAVANILAGDSFSSVTFYANQADLDANMPIPASSWATYINAVAWNDTVLARVARTNSAPGSPECAAVVTLSLKVNPLPQITEANGDIQSYTICSATAGTGYEVFNLLNHVQGLLTASGNNPADYYVRFYASMADVSAGRALPYVYTNTIQYQQQIFVRVQNTVTGCEFTAPLWLNAGVTPTINPIVVNATITECDNADGVDDGYAIFDLTAAGQEALGTPAPANYSVQYFTSATDAAGNINAIVNPTAFSNTVYGGQQIWVRITNETTPGKCYVVLSFNIVVNTLQTPLITSTGGHDTLCIDYNNGTVYRYVVLNSSLVNPGYTYSWYRNGVQVPGTISASYTVATAGDYTLQITDAFGCTVTSAVFTVQQSGPASLIGNGIVVSNAFTSNQKVTVLAEGYGEYQYSIAPEREPATGPWQNSNVFENLPLGYYTVYIRDIKTDDACDMVPVPGVSVIDYPKFFTPNADGYNDYWNITGMTQARYPDAKIMIFDRYGKLLKQIRPAQGAIDTSGWDGTYNGHPLPSDDYWFSIEFTENGIKREYKAHFAMKR